MGAEVKLAVAIIGAVGALIFGGAAVKVYDNNKHNKDRKNWQDNMNKAQNKASYYQQDSLNKEKRIHELEAKLSKTQIKLNDVTKKLAEADEMIELLEERMSVLENYQEKEKLRDQIAYHKTQRIAYQNQQNYLFQEINATKAKITEAR